MSTYEIERSPPPGGMRFAAMLAADWSYSWTTAREMVMVSVASHRLDLGEFSRPFDLHHSAGERGGESNAEHDDDENADRMNDVRVVPAEEREGEQAERADDARVEVLGPSERVACAGLRARGLHASPPKVRGAHGAARASSGLLDLRPHQSLICGSEAL